MTSPNARCAGYASSSGSMPGLLWITIRVPLPSRCLWLFRYQCWPRKIAVLDTNCRTPCNPLLCPSADGASSWLDLLCQSIYITAPMRQFTPVKVLLPYATLQRTYSAWTASKRLFTGPTHVPIGRFTLHAPRLPLYLASPRGLVIDCMASRSVNNISDQGLRFD